MATMFMDTEHLADNGVNARVVEAARIFRKGMTGSYSDQARLQEALSTSDFPALLGQALEFEVLDLFRSYTKAWEGVADTTTVSDFRPKSLRGLYGAIDYLPINEAEEYKAASLAETEHKINVETYGRLFKFTRQMKINKDWDILARIPERLAKGAAMKEDQAVFGALTGANGVNREFFKDAYAPDNKPLTAENLMAAYTTLAQRKGLDDGTADISKLVLVVPRSLEMAARRILEAEYIDVTEGKVKTRETNILKGLFTLKVVDILTRLDKSATANTTWYILPAAGSANPALIKASLQGYEQPDLRVESAAGRSISGADIAPEEGSFLDDTISYRGRHEVGAATLFPFAAYASTGA